MNTNLSKICMYSMQMQQPFTVNKQIINLELSNAGLHH